MQDPPAASVFPDLDFARDVLENMSEAFFLLDEQFRLIDVNQAALALDKRPKDGFVRQSGGQIRVYTEVGTGTTMCLYLPRYIGEAMEEDHHLGSEIAEMGAGEAVLVIDDEPTVRMLIVDVLNEAGYTAIEAEDGPSGLKALQSNPHVALLITDVGLPGGMNGRQVADAARELRPGLKVLFVTGYAENAAVSGGHLEPGMAVVTKPFVMAELAHKITEMIELDA